MSFWVPERLTEDRFRLRATPAGCVGIPGRRAMMGGVTSGACITALEQATGRWLLWSSTQFVSHAPAEGDFDIAVDLVAEGRRTTQARATMTHAGRVVLVTSAVLTVSADDPAQGFQPRASPPVADRPPEQCPAKDGAGTEPPGDLMAQFERREAYQSDDEGAERLWFRPVVPVRTTAGLLAVLGDFLPGATSMTRGSSSVDNTLRMVSRRETEWVLADTRLHALQGRLLHGSMHLYAQCGALLAVASQSGITPR